MRPTGASSAYVLHQYAWSESSLILELYTREKGRVTAIAKGAKRPYSQLRSILLPFQHILVTMTRGSARAREGEVSDIQTLRSAEWVGGSAMLGGAALFSGFYLNELMMKLLVRHEPHPLLFDAYVQVLQGLSQPQETLAQAALRAFEVQLLSEVGVLPDLSLCTVTQQSLVPERLYLLTADMGVVEGLGAASADDMLPGGLLVGLQAALVAGSFSGLQQTCALALRPLKVALRALLHYHLGFSTLRTRQLMLDMQALERRTAL